MIAVWCAVLRYRRIVAVCMQVLLQNCRYGESIDVGNVTLLRKGGNGVVLSMSSGLPYLSVVVFPNSLSV